MKTLIKTTFAALALVLPAMATQSADAGYGCGHGYGGYSSRSYSSGPIYSSSYRYSSPVYRPVIVEKSYIYTPVRVLHNHDHYDNFDYAPSNFGSFQGGGHFGGDGHAH